MSFKDGGKIHSVTILGHDERAGCSFLVSASCVCIHDVSVSLILCLHHAGNRIWFTEKIQFYLTVWLGFHASISWRDVALKRFSSMLLCGRDSMKILQCFHQLERRSIEKIQFYLTVWLGFHEDLSMLPLAGETQH